MNLLSINKNIVIVIVLVNLCINPSSRETAWLVNVDRGAEPWPDKPGKNRLEEISIVIPKDIHHALHRVIPLVMKPENFLAILLCYEDYSLHP